MGRIDLDLASQPGDAQVDGAIERVGLAMRRDLQQPIAHQWPVRVLGKDLQQIELARSHALLNAVGAGDQHAPLEIQNAPADPDSRAPSRRPAGTPQYALYPTVNRVLSGTRCVVLC